MMSRSRCIASQAAEIGRRVYHRAAKIRLFPCCYERAPARMARVTGSALHASRLVSICAVAAMAAAPALAQDLPAPPLPVTPPAAAAAAPAASVSAANRGLIMPAERSADIQAHWSARREYVRDRDERRADDEEQRGRSLKDDLAIENLFFISGALVRESQEALASGAPALALSRCKLAVEFAPAFPEAHYCLARAMLADNISAVRPAFDEMWAGVSAGANDPRISRAVLANVLGMLFAGLLAPGLRFVLVLLTRYAMLYAHDLHHLFPVGARRWKTKMLAAVLILSPLFLPFAPLPLIFTALLSPALYATPVD